MARPSSSAPDFAPLVAEIAVFSRFSPGVRISPSPLCGCVITGYILHGLAQPFVSCKLRCHPCNWLPLPAAAWRTAFCALGAPVFAAPCSGVPAACSKSQSLTCRRCVMALRGVLPSPGVTTWIGYSNASLVSRAAASHGTAAAKVATRQYRFPRCEVIAAHPAADLPRSTAEVVTWGGSTRGRAAAGARAGPLRRGAVIPLHADATDDAADLLPPERPAPLGLDRGNARRSRRGNW